MSFYNSIGNNVFNISYKNLSQNPHVLEAGDAVASMIFVKARVKSPKWAYEFLVITYSGLLKAYYVSVTDAYEETHKFSFGSFYRNGVTAVAYMEKHNLLFVAGSNITQNLNVSKIFTGRRVCVNPAYRLVILISDNFFQVWNHLLANTERLSVLQVVLYQRREREYQVGFFRLELSSQFEASGGVDCLQD